VDEIAFGPWYGQLGSEEPGKGLGFKKPNNSYKKVPVFLTISISTTVNSALKLFPLFDMEHHELYYNYAFTLFFCTKAHSSTICTQIHL
jgi:hypothetical protein